MSDQVDFQALFDKVNNGPVAFDQEQENNDLFDTAKKAGLGVNQYSPGDPRTLTKAQTADLIEQELRNNPLFRLNPEQSKLLYDKWQNTDFFNRYAGIPVSAFKEMVPHVLGQLGGAVKDVFWNVPFKGGYKKLGPTAMSAGYQWAGGTADLGYRLWRFLKDAPRDALGVGGPEGELERFRERQNNFQVSRQIAEGAIDDPTDYNPDKPGRQGPSDAPDVLPDLAFTGSVFIPMPGGAVSGALKSAAGSGLRAAGRGLLRSGVVSAENAVRAAEAAALVSRLAEKTSKKLDKLKSGVANLPAKSAEKLVEKVGLDPKVGAGAVEQALHVARKPFTAFREALEGVPPEFKDIGAIPRMGTGAVEAGLSISEKGLEAIRRLRELPPSQSGRLRQLAAEQGTPTWLKNVAMFLDKTKVGAASEMVSDLTRGVPKAVAHGYATGLLLSDDPQTPGQFAAINFGQTGFVNGIRKVAGRSAAYRRAQGIRGDLAGLYLHLEENGASPEFIKNLKDNEALIMAAFDNPNATAPDGTRLSDTVYGSAGLAATYLANLNKRIKIKYLSAEQFAEAHPDSPDSVGSHKDNEVHINMGSVEKGTSLAGGTMMHELAHNLAKVAGKEGTARIFIDNLMGPEKVAEARSGYAEKTLQGKGVDNPTPEQIAQQAAELDALHKGDSWVYSEIYAEAAKKAFSTDIMRDVLGRNRSIWRRVRNAVADHFSSATKASELPADALFAISEVYSPEMRRRLTQDLRDMYQQDAGRVAPRENEAIGVSIEQVQKGTPAVAKDADGLRVDANNRLVYDEKAARRMQTQRAVAVRRAVGKMPAAPANDTAPDVKPRAGLDGRTEVAQGTRVSPLMESTGLFSKTALDIVKTIEQVLASGSGSVARLWYNPIGTSAEGRSWNADVAFRRGNIPASQVDMAFYDFHVSKAGHVLARGMSLTAAERRLAEWSANPESPLNQLWNGDVDAFRKDLDTYLSNHAKDMPGDTGIGVQRKNALNYFIIGRLARLADLNPLRVQSAKSLIRSLRVDRMASLSVVQDKAMPLNYRKLAENFSPEVTGDPTQYAAPGRKPVEGYDLTKDEFLRRFGNQVAGATMAPNHHQRVREAIARGMAVPANVLADYPDLQWAYSQKQRGAAAAAGAPISTAQNLELNLNDTRKPKVTRKDGLPDPVDDPATTPYPRADKAAMDAALQGRGRDPFTGLPTWYDGTRTPDRVQSLIDIVPKSTLYRDLVVHLMFDQQRRQGQAPTQAQLREAWIKMAKEEDGRLADGGTPEGAANTQAIDLVRMSDADVKAWVSANKPSREVVNALARARDVLPVIPQNSALGRELSNPSLNYRMAGGSEGRVYWFPGSPDYVYKVVTKSFVLNDVQRVRGNNELTASYGAMLHGTLTKTDRQSRLPGGLPADIIGITRNGDVVLKMPEMLRHANAGEVQRWKNTIGAVDGLGTIKSPMSVVIGAALANQPAVNDKAGNFYITGDLRLIPHLRESPNVMVDRSGRVYATDIMLLPVDEAVLNKNPQFRPDLNLADRDKVNYSPESGKEFDKFDPRNYPEQPPAPAGDVVDDIYGRVWDGWDIKKLTEVIHDNKGGFTADKAANFRGTGYAVAPWKKTERRISAENMDERSLQEYIQEHVDLFRTHGAHLGGWLNREAEGGPKYVLDIVFPVEKIEDAVRLAVWGDQDAIFHLDTMTEIKTKKNETYVDANGTQQERKVQIVPDGVPLTLDQIWSERGRVDDLRAFASKAVRDAGAVREEGGGPNQEVPLGEAEAAGRNPGDAGEPGARPDAEPPLTGPTGEFSPPTRRANPEEVVKEGVLRSAPAANVDGHLIMSSRVPVEKRKNKLPAEADEVLFLDKETIDLIPKESLDAIVQKVKDTAGIFTHAEMLITDSRELLSIFMDRTIGNLRWLWDKAEPWRERAKLWYDGANKMANEWAQKYGLSVNQVAAVLAACSPKTDWFKNIEIAKRIIEGTFYHRDNNTILTKELFAEYERARKEARDTKIAEIKGENISNYAKRKRVAALRKTVSEQLDKDRLMVGKSWNELSGRDRLGQAIILRAWDVLNKDQNYHVYSPEGTPLYIKVNATKKRNPKTGKMEFMPAAQGWTTYDIIGSSIEVIHNGTPENISNVIGQAHKVRNFYNNILVPTSNYPFVTIDTHAVNASFLLPGAADSKHVLGSTSAVGGVGAERLGIKGAYILHAVATIELARRLTEETGKTVLPREVQSVTWEAIRALFTKTEKGDLSAGSHALNELWREGKLSRDEYLKQLEQYWGGFDTPEWAMGQEPGAPAEQGVIPAVEKPAGYSGVSSGVGGRGLGSGRDSGAVAEGRGGTGAVLEEGRGAAPDGGANPAGTEGDSGPRASGVLVQKGVSQFSPAVLSRKLGRNSDFAKPPSDKAAKEALDRDNQPLYGKHRDPKHKSYIPSGSQVGLRIDIPAFNRNGTYVVTVHDRRGINPSTKNPGKVAGYDNMGRVSNPTFAVSETAAKMIYDGKITKKPIAVVNGLWNPSKEIPADIDKWAPLGFDPKDHSFFYDKRTDQLVLSGDEAVSVGNTVFVKNPVYGTPAQRDAKLYSPASRPRNNQWVSDFEKRAQTQSDIPMEVLLREFGTPRDTSFHVNTLVMRMLNTLNPGETADRIIQNARARGAEDRAVAWEKKRDTLNEALSYVRPLLADLVASLPAKRSKDLRTGTMVDPYLPMRQSFPGGTKRDVTEVLAEMGNVVRSTIPDPVNRRGALEHILNLARVAREQGAKVNPAFIDHLFVDVHGMTEAELIAYNSRLMSQMFSPEFFDKKDLGGNLSAYSPINPKE